jgi:hypothetical protein
MQLPKIAEVESRSVRVTWCEPEGCNTTEPTQWTYRLEMAHGRDSKFLFVYNGTDMQHLVENLQAGKEYSFRCAVYLLCITILDICLNIL